MKLQNFNNADFDRGRSLLIEVFWVLILSPLFSSFIPGSYWRIIILRLFGSEIGEGVVIKPGVKIKFPWKLKVGNYSWIGEQVWIDNLDYVLIGSNSCISQGSYLCTGSHDWSKDSFNLVTRRIVIGDEVWVCAFCKVGPGVKIGNKSVVKFSSKLVRSIPKNSVFSNE